MAEQLGTVKLSKSEKQQLSSEQRKLYRQKRDQHKKNKKEAKQMRRELKLSQSAIESKLAENVFEQKRDVGQTAPKPTVPPLVQGKSIQNRAQVGGGGGGEAFTLQHDVVKPVGKPKQNEKNPSVKNFQDMNQGGGPIAVTTDKSLSKQKCCYVTMISMLGLIVLLLCFIFLQLALRTSGTLSVSSDGILHAMKDPFGLNTVKNVSAPVQVALYESKGSDLLELALISLEDIHQIHSLRFSFKKDNDWIATSSQIATGSRTSDGSTTTIRFTDGGFLTLDSNYMPPNQVMYTDTDKSSYQVLVTGQLEKTASVQSMKTCAKCPENSYLDTEGTCQCNHGYKFNTTSFECIAQQSRRLGHDDSDIHSSYVWPFEYNNQGKCFGVFQEATDTEEHLFESPARDNLSEDFECDTDWTYIDKDDATNKTYIGNNCASIFLYHPKQSHLHRSAIERLREELGDPNLDLFWCPAKGNSNYRKDVLSNKDQDDYRWGFCAPCTKLPTAQPSTHPTQTLKPTSFPTSEAPTVNPSASPTAPTKSPTAPTANPTAAPTKDTRVETRKPSAAPSSAAPSSAAPSSAAPSVSPSVRPSANPTTQVPSKGPSASPTTKTFSPTTGPTEPTLAPSMNPTMAPSTAPSSSPTAPTTQGPTGSPTAGPTMSPTAPTSLAPTANPTVPTTVSPTGSPTPGINADQCIKSGCQDRRMSIEAAHKFCSQTMDMQLCTHEQFSGKMRRFEILAKSSATMRQQLFDHHAFRDFRCFKRSGVVDSWVASTTCAAGLALKMHWHKLSGLQSKCVPKTEKLASAVCCEKPPSAEIIEQRKRNAKSYYESAYAQKTQGMRASQSHRNSRLRKRQSSL